MMIDLKNEGLEVVGWYRMDDRKAITPYPSVCATWHKMGAKVGAAYSDSAQAIIDGLRGENKALHAQVKVLQSGENCWQSGYDQGRLMGAKHCTGTIDQLRAELAALNAKLDASKFCANVADVQQVSVPDCFERYRLADKFCEQRLVTDDHVRAIVVDAFATGYGFGIAAAPVAKQVVMPEPDMFWDAENPEDSFACSEREMFINLADNISMSDGKIIINLMRAARLPSIAASVWVTEDSEGEREVHFDYLSATPAPIPDNSEDVRAMVVPDRSDVHTSSQPIGKGW